MLISIITLFPEMFQSVFGHSIIKRALENGHIKIRYVHVRDFGIGNHKTVDEPPYGGGTGMVLRADVLDKAVSATREGVRGERVVLLDPRGKQYVQTVAERFSTLSHLILVAGHYEGFDERIREFADEEVSVGDFVLTGGEIPAMVVVDSVARLLPHVLKKRDATSLESFSRIGGKRLLEYPQYTRPKMYKQRSVPEILLSGDHKKIEKYRKNEALRITKIARPDLLKR